MGPSPAGLVHARATRPRAVLTCDLGLELLDGRSAAVCSAPARGRRARCPPRIYPASFPPPLLAAVSGSRVEPASSACQGGFRGAARSVSARREPSARSCRLLSGRPDPHADRSPRTHSARSRFFTRWPGGSFPGGSRSCSCRTGPLPASRVLGGERGFLTPVRKASWSGPACLFCFLDGKAWNALSSALCTPGSLGRPLSAASSLPQRGLPGLPHLKQLPSHSWSLSLSLDFSLYPNPWNGGSFIIKQGPHLWTVLTHDKDGLKKNCVVCKGLPRTLCSPRPPAPYLVGNDCPRGMRR